jgi:HEAT repeat protein
MRVELMHVISKRGWIGVLSALTVMSSLGCADYEWAIMNPWVRRQWAEDEKFGPTLHQQLGDLDRIRRTAPSMTEDQRQRHATQLSQLFQNEPSPLLRGSIARTAGVLRAQASVPTLRAALTDGDRNVRIAACEGWADFGGPTAIEALAGAVGGDTDLDVRMAATRGLGRFQDRTAYQALGLALDDADPALQRRAVESLRTSSGKDYGNDVVAWKEFVQGGNPRPVQPTLAERFGNFFR